MTSLRHPISQDQAGYPCPCSVNLCHAKVLHLPVAKKSALVIPMPALERASSTFRWKNQPHLGADPWNLSHWTFNPDPKQSWLPTFGAYTLGIEVARPDTQVPQWAALDLMDRASKKGKGQLPILIGALYKGREAHVSLSAGGNDMAQSQLKIPLVGVVTTSEKYTLVGPSVRFQGTTGGTTST